MFENNDEVMAKNLIDDIISTEAKRIIATSIFLAMKIAKKVCMKKPNLPLTSKYEAGCILRFIIYEIAAEMSEKYPLAHLRYAETSANNPVDFYFSDKAKLHIKKCANQEKLPELSRVRAQNAKINNQLSLFDEEEYATYFCLVTYSHKGFGVQYIQIGVPNADYTGWLYRVSIMEYIDIDQAEEIEKMYGDEMEAAMQEKIQKNFGLTLNMSGDE